MPVEIKDIKQKSISGSSNPIEEYFNDKQKALKQEPSTAITKSNPIDDYFKKKSGTENGGVPSPTPSPTPSPSPEKDNEGYLDVLKKWFKKGQEALAAKKSEPVEETEFDSGARTTTLEQARKQGGLAVFKKAKKLKVEAGNGVILDLDPSIASNISEPNYNADIESIQKRIKEGKVLPEDINIISALAKKTPEATAAYLTGDTQKGLAIDNTENQKTLRSDMIRSITHYNEETGEENDPEAILGSAQKTVEFIQKLKQQKAAKIQQGFDLEKQALEGQQGAQATFVDGKFVPTPVQQNVATDGLDAESFINKANEYQELLKSHVITQTIQEDELNGVSKEQTLKNIARRTNPRLYYQSINAEISSKPNNLLNPSVINPLNITKSVGKLYDDLFGTDEQDELLNTQYGAALLMYNEHQQQIANNEISQGILTGDQELLTKGKGRLANVQNQNEILLQYPSLMKQKIAQDVSKELAFKAGQLEGSETKDYKTKFLGAGIGDIYATEAMQKYLVDPDTRDLAASMLPRTELFSDASYLGGVGDALMQPARDLGYSLMDMTKFRTNKDVLSDKIKDELFPKEMEGTKADFTVPILGDIRVRHIANTTANLTGMAVVAAGTSSIATPLGASANVAKSLSAYTSFGLPTYDGALKDSYNFLDNDNARVLYAGIASIVNAEGGRFLDIGKVIKIPGVSENFAKIADGITKNNITQKGVQQLLKKGENAYVDFAVKYGKNVTKGAATMAYFNITNNIERLAFGDDRIKEAEVLPQAAHAFVDGVLGMTIMGAFGARADMKAEKNTSFKSTIYNLALNHDASKDMLKISLDKGFYTPEQYNEKLQVLNTAIAAKNSLDLSEQQLNRNLTQDQKSVYVANKTAESVLREKASDKNISEADKIKYTEQADRLRQQSKDVMDGLRFSPTLEPLYDLFNAEKEYDRALSEFDNTPKSQRRVEVAKENYDGLVNKYFAENTKPTKSKESLTTEDLMPTIVVNGKEYSGKNHGEAMDKAIAAGENIPDKDTPEGKAWRSENGMFKDKDGNLLSRDESGEQYGIRNSEELADNRKVLSDEAHRAIDEAVKSGAINDTEASVLNTTENKIQFLKQVAEQAKGELADGTKVGEGGEQSRAARKKYGEEIVDEALKLFPIEAKEVKDIADTEISKTFGEAKPFISEKEIEIVEPIIERVNKAENINEKEITDAEDALYNVLDKHPNAAHLIEPLISKLQDYEFKTKTESRTVTEKVPVETVRETVKREPVSKAIEQWEGNRATVTDKEGKSTTGIIRVENGKYSLFNENGDKVASLGEKQITDRDITLPSKEDVPMPIQVDADGNIKSITLQLNKVNKERGGVEKDKLITIEFKDPEKALDYAIRLRAEEVGQIDPKKFDMAYEEISKEVKEEVLIDKDMVKSQKVIEEMDSAAQSKKSVREKEKEMEKVAEKNGELGKKALELNRNFDSIVKFLKDNNKIEVKCP